MRDYGKVSPQFWIGETGKRLRKAGAEAQVVALYLMTCSHSNMIGLYYLPVMYIAHETGLGMEGALKGLQRASEAGFCQYDEDSEMVWVIEMAKFQIDAELSAADKRCKGVQNEYDAQPENPYLARFFERYGAAYHMTKMRGEISGKVSPLEAPSEALGSQEQEQEQEQETDTPSGLPPEPVPPADSAKQKGKSAVTLKTFMDDCQSRGESVIEGYEPVLKYAEKVGLPEEMLSLCWVEFKSKYLPGGVNASKKYKDWRLAFLGCVRDNWFKLWWVGDQGEFGLTTRGKQAELVCKEAA
ncbi:hypothetical protein [Achromobacter marplatensis]|uniref:hypothetical protein n=1 Tax=Achromobacter marplatensis TaxID=470868 RepID=UPI003C74660B